MSSVRQRKKVSAVCTVQSLRSRRTPATTDWIGGSHAGAQTHKVLEKKPSTTENEHNVGSVGKNCDAPHSGLNNAIHGFDRQLIGFQHHVSMAQDRQSARMVSRMAYRCRVRPHLVAFWRPCQPLLVSGNIYATGCHQPFRCRVLVAVGRLDVSVAGGSFLAFLSLFPAMR